MARSSNAIQKALNEKLAPLTTPAKAPRKRAAKKVVEVEVVSETTTKECPFLRAIGADEFMFPADTDHFYKDKSTKDGLAVWSKQGERIYNKGYNARKALMTAEEAVKATKAGSKARKEANEALAVAQAKVDEAEALGAFKYGRVKRVHGSALGTPNAPAVVAR